MVAWLHTACHRASGERNRSVADRRHRVVVSFEEIDESVSASVLQALSPEQVAEFRGEAQRAIERHRGRVDDAALVDAMDRYTLQRAREKLGLIRVALA